MDSGSFEPTSVCHVVAMPYPGRGHINPMMDLCKLLTSKRADLLITFVVTEEWLGFIGSQTKPANIRFASIPNVIPSELDRASDFPGFLQAVSTKMEDPFERLLERLEPPPTTIVADTYLTWAVWIGNRRNIPVASFWTMSATMFSVLHHFDLLVQNRQFPAELSERGDELVDYIPGISSTRLADLPTFFSGTGRKTLHLAVDAISAVPKAQYLLLTSPYELEPQVIDALIPKFPFPIYPVGPTIPFYELEDNSPIATTTNYFHWLDSQPRASVLYISLGSFLSISSAQMDELVSGVRKSGVRFMWVARGETSRFQEDCGNMGFVVPWCDQLKVLRHSSIGGFWSHCGLNSTLEAIYAGVPMLTFPIFWDQIPNSKSIVEDWKIGWRVKRAVSSENLVTREEISTLVQRFMDLESNEGKEMRQRARELQEICRGAIAKGGSSMTSLEAFISDISQCRGC